jgi:A/G-specific adenine glycosylase
MEPVEHARAFQPALAKALLAWFRKHARDLPFRRTRDPYAVWLSEIILQQTRVEQGLPYYERFMRAFPTVSDLASADPDAVLKLWEGLGYYGRARRLHQCAREVVDKHGGRFPETAAELQALPGLGPYTAGAVASIAFGEQVPVVDGNVTRVLARLFDLDTDTDTSAGKTLLWDLARTLVPARHPGDFNQALMELGARVCAPARPACDACPVATHCLARERGTQALRPVRRPKAPVPSHEVVVAAIRKNGRYLIGKRPEGGLLGGLWEFPGGKVGPGETHEQALLRESREELGVEVKVGGLVATVRHAYTHFRITLSAYRCSLANGTPRPLAHTE